MQIGIILPQNEIGDDPEAIRDFSAAAEDEGFKHIVAFDHVVGKDDYASQPFHEPFVLFGFLAAVHAHDRARRPGSSSCRSARRRSPPSRRPRSTCSPAAACGSALGVGWNPVEYEALGEDFPRAASAFDEQIALHAAAVDRAACDGRARPRAPRRRRAQPARDPQHPDLARRQGARRGAARGRPRLGPDPLGHGRSRRGRDVRRRARPAERRRRRRRPAPRGARDRGLAGHEGRRSGLPGAPRSRAGRPSARRT